MIFLPDLSGSKFSDPLWLLAPVVILALFSGIVSSPFIAVGAFFCYVVYMKRLADKAPFTFIFGLPLWFLWLTEMSSLVAIEFGAYMNEVGDFGYATGATARLCIIYILMVTPVVKLVDGKFDASDLANWIVSYRKFPYWRFFSGFVIVLSLLMTGYLFIEGLKNGFPLITGVDRFTFRKELDDSLFVSIIDNRPVVISFLSVMLFGGYRKSAFFIFALYIFVSVLFAEKFTSLMMMLSVFIVASLVEDLWLHGKIRVFRLLKPLLLILPIVFIVILIVYGALDDLSGALEAFRDRFAVQGQMWFVGDRDYFSLFSFDARVISADISSWFDWSVQNPASVSLAFGRYYFMADYVDNELLDWILNLNVGYVFTYFPYWLKISGYFGLVVISVAGGGILGVVMRYLVGAFSTVDVVAMFMAQKAYFLILYGIVTGYAYNVFGIKIIFIIVFISVWTRFGLLNKK